METDFTLKQLLVENYLKWQNDLGKVKTQKEFAEEVLDLHEVTFSRYFNEKHKPSKAVLVQMAEKTGDPRFYDLAGAPRPDPDLAALKAVWKYIPEEQRHALRKQGEAYAQQNHNHPD